MDGVIAPSDQLARLTAAMTGDSQRVRYIPNGVDASRFHPDAPGADWRARYGIRPEETVILCPRRLVKKNGCVFLARALPAIVAAEPSARVLFAGDGPERESIAAELDAARCLSRATFTGSIPNSEMPAAYAASDVVVVPSLVEATSISVLEAMAAARPVVASRTGGLPALVEEGTTGYLVQPDDVTGLAAAIARLLSDSDRRARMGEAARDRVLREFTWDRIAALTVEVSREFLLGSRAQAHSGQRGRLCPRSR
jgi:glycosyltransferase involved in cell wall biosynthesis